MESNMMAIIEYKEKRSEVYREGAEFVVNFYESNNYKNSARFTGYMEAFKVAEQYAGSKQQFLVD
jgi:hypothetical protein